MGNKRRCNVRYLAILTLCVLTVAGRVGCNKNIKLQLVAQTSPDSQDFYSAKSFRERRPARIKNRADPSRRLLLTIITAIATAAVTFVVLRCSLAVGLKRRLQKTSRALAYAGNKDLAACGGTSDDQQADSPTTNRLGVDVVLEKRVRRILEDVEDFSKILTTAALQMPVINRMTMLIRLMVLASLELGALAALLEGPLANRRKEVCQVVLDAVSKVLGKESGGEAARTRRHRLNRMLRMMKEIKENRIKATLITFKDRHAMLLDFIYVQEIAVKLELLVAKKIAHLSVEEYQLSSPEAMLLEKQLALLCYRRKMQILGEKKYCSIFKEFARLSNCREIGTHMFLASPQALMPLPSAPEQVQQLHAALSEAEQIIAQQSDALSSSLQPQPEDDTSMPPQQPESISAHYLEPTDSPFQTQLGNHSLLQPGVAMVLPPQHEDGVLSHSQPELALHQAHDNLLSSASFPSPSLKQAQSGRRIHFQKGAEHDYAPADGMPSSRPEAASSAASSFHSLRAGALGFFPLTQLRAPGAHRHGSAFHGFPEGSPAPLGHSEDPSLDGSVSELMTFLQAALANLEQSDKLF